MTTRDTPEAALAAALNKTVGEVGWLHFTPASPVEEWLENAAAILTALDGWALVRGPIRESIAEMNAEIARLREALEDALGWIARDCQPQGVWAADGHNMAMSGHDRERGEAILAHGRAALAPSEP